MSTLALTHVIQATPAFLQRLGHSFSSFIDGIGEARGMAARYQALARMSDLQLASHGLTRDQIPQAVFAGRAHT
jgi:hypothetical protein